MRLLKIAAATLIVSVLMQASEASAQITQPRVLSASQDKYANLKEQLTNRLRATKREQHGYINYVVKQVQKQKLEMRLVVAVERYALRRHPYYPFPYFERAMKVEAGKRGIAMPPVHQFATSRIVIE